MNATIRKTTAQPIALAVDFQLVSTGRASLGCEEGTDLGGHSGDENGGDGDLEDVTG
jgi:hypothetical protein